jgi:hypothetical protein
MPVKGGSEYGGYEQYFSYKVKNAAGKDERGGWIMTEYGISREHGGGGLVLCKIHPSPRSSSTKVAVPVSDHTVSSKKRKAADDEHPEDPSASSRPRRTDDHDQHLLPVESLESDLTSMNAAEQGDQFIIFDEDPMAEFKMKFPLLFDDPVAEEPEWYVAADQAAPPSNFMQNMEQDFWSLYQNDVVMPEGDLVMPPCAPAAQPEDDAAAGLLQTITAEDVPSKNYNHEDTMCASLGEEQTAPEPDKTAADEGIYGLPCPAFSPEMVRRCNDDLMMPWLSPSSMSMTFGLY